MGKRKPLTQQELDDIYYFIDSYISSKKRLCSTAEISEGTKLSYSRVDDIVTALISAGRLKIVYEIPRKVRLFAPEHFVESLAKSRPIVPWLSSYYFPEKLKLSEQFSGVQNQLKDFEQFELLLTSTGEELVNAIGHTLKWLGFSVKVTESSGHEDVEISDGPKHAILEIKGLEKHARIDELRQAVDYHLRKIGKKEKKRFLLFYWSITTDLRTHPNANHHSPKRFCKPLQRTTISSAC